MLKYISTEIVYREVPDMVSRAFSISNCGQHCKGCHSPELQGDNGNRLTLDIIDKYINEDWGKIDCYVFLGEGQDKETLEKILHFTHNRGFKTCLYTYRSNLTDIINDYCPYLDYIKTGEYIENLGGLDSKNTNQRFYEIKDNLAIDITNKFKKNED